MSRAKAGIAKEIKDKEVKEVIITLCENIKRLREKIGLSQQELADSSGISKSTIFEIEQLRVVNLNIKTVVMIARGLDKPYLSLFKKVK